MQRFTGLGGALVMLLFAAAAFAAEVPGYLVHQGYLRDRGTGRAVAENTSEKLKFEFSLYDVLDGGAPIWSSGAQEVEVMNGFYYVEIGGPQSGLLEKLRAGGDLYLQVTVGTDVMAKRQRIGSVPYAQVCQEAKDATGDIHARSVSVGGTPVIDSNGKWTGDMTGLGTVKSVGTTGPLSGGTITTSGTIGIYQAGTDSDGYLSKTDWAKFEGKQNRVSGKCNGGFCAYQVNEDGSMDCYPCGASGTVTSVATGPGLTGGPVTASGTISLDNAWLNGSTYDDRFVNEGQAASITTAMIQPDAVTTAKILDGAVTAAKLETSYANGSAYDTRFVNEGQTLSVSTGMLQDDAVNVDKLDAAFKDGSAYDARFFNVSGDTVAANGLTVGVDQLVCKAGNVGVGESAPSARVEVKGGGEINGSGNITSSGTSVTGTGTTFTSQLHVGDVLVVASQKRVVTAIASDVSLTTATPFNPVANNSTYAYQQPTMKLADNAGNPQVVVSPLGGVGIGTSTPDYVDDAGSTLSLFTRGQTLLQLVSARADGDHLSLAGVDGRFNTNTAGHERVAHIAFQSDGSTAGQRGGRIELQTKPDGSTDLMPRMTITQNGDVGIGTTAPTGKLDVNGSIVQEGVSPTRRAGRNFLEFSGNKDLSNGVATDLFSVAVRQFGFTAGQVWISALDYTTDDSKEGFNVMTHFSGVRDNDSNGINVSKTDVWHSLISVGPSAAPTFVTAVSAVAGGMRFTVTGTGYAAFRVSYVCKVMVASNGGAAVDESDVVVF